jgi:hypothetical protein
MIDPDIEADTVLGIVDGTSMVHVGEMKLDCEVNDVE